MRPALDAARMGVGLISGQAESMRTRRHKKAPGALATKRPSSLPLSATSVRPLRSLWFFQHSLPIPSISTALLRLRTLVHCAEKPLLCFHNLTHSFFCNPFSCTYLRKYRGCTPLPSQLDESTTHSIHHRDLRFATESTLSAPQADEWATRQQVPHGKS